MKTAIQFSADGTKPSKRKRSNCSDSVVQISKKSRIGTKSSPIALSESEDVLDSEEATGLEAGDSASQGEHLKILLEELSQETNLVVSPDTLSSEHVTQLPIHQADGESSSQTLNQNTSCSPEECTQMKDLKQKLLAMALLNATLGSSPGANAKFLPNVNPPSATLTSAFIKDHPLASGSQSVDSAVDVAGSENARSSRPFLEITSDESSAVNLSRPDTDYRATCAGKNSSGQREIPGFKQELKMDASSTPMRIPNTTSGTSSTHNFFQNPFTTMPILPALPPPTQDIWPGQLRGTQVYLPPPEVFASPHPVSYLSGSPTAQNIGQTFPKKPSVKSLTVERNADAVMQVIKDAVGLKHVEHKDVGVQTEANTKTDVGVNTE